MITADTIIAEVRRLHGFFDDWFAGRQGRSIDEFSDALDDEFTIVGPHGSVMTRTEVVGVVEQRFGVGDVAITVENFHVRRLGDMYVCRYDELQDVSGDRTRRISTAILASDDSTPRGLVWITVHETFVDA